MGQIGKPRGLIDYCTLDDAAVEKAGGTAQHPLRTILRPRTLIYFTLWAAIGFAMLFALGARTRLDLSVQHDRNPVFVQLSDGMIRNNYTIKVRNMEARPRRVALIVTSLADATIWTADATRTRNVRQITVDVPADSVQKVRLFVAAPARGEEREEFTIRAEAQDGDRRGDSDEVVFERPEREDEEQGE
jgi:polyferredoxin